MNKSLKDIREENNLTQEQLAKKAGLTYKAYWNIETGKSDPKLSTLINIAKALNIKTADLINSITLH